MKGLREGAGREENFPFLKVSNPTQVKIVHLDANLIRQLIYIGSHFGFKVPSNSKTLLCNLYGRNFAML